MQSRNEKLQGNVNIDDITIIYILHTFLGSRSTMVEWEAL